MTSTIIACGAEHQNVTRNDAIRYYLNQRDYEQAISLLNERIAENPSDDAAKILLASAYSGSVGINTIDCFDVLRPKLFDRPLSEQKTSEANSLFASATDDLPVPALQPDKEKPTPEQQKQHAIAVVEKELLKFAGEAGDALQIAFRLPHVPVNDRNRIALSLSILGEVAETSDQYLTAQLYQGILALVQFMNYVRDGIPVDTRERTLARAWYLSLYCQMDLGVLLPNLSQAVDYMSIAFTSLSNAGRKSNNPVYTNLELSKSQLAAMNRTYLLNQDLFDFADWSLRATKDSLCE